jgi:hypothetical protein
MDFRDAIWSKYNELMDVYSQMEFADQCKLSKYRRSTDRIQNHAKKVYNIMAGLVKEAQDALTAEKRAIKLGMNLEEIAYRIAADTADPNILSPRAEHSIQFELKVVADFVGDTTEKSLIGKLDDEIRTAVSSGISTTANEFGLDLDRTPIIKPIEFKVKPGTEYSVQFKLMVSINFEGNVAKDRLIGKLHDELIAAVRTGMSTTAADLGVAGVGAKIKPIEFDYEVVE